MSTPTDPERQPSAEEILGTPPKTNELDAALARPARRGRSFSSTMLLVLGVLVAVGFVGGLLLGRATAPDASALPAGFPDGANLPGGATGADGAFPSGGFTAGTIRSVDGDTLTIETVDGQTVEVRTSGGTDVQVTSKGSVDELAEGDTVVVQGKEQNDGSLDATNITEGGLGSGGGFPGAPSSSG
jgi:myosin-like protein